MKSRITFFLIWIVVGEILFSLLVPREGEAKNRFIGFKKDKKKGAVPEGWEIITYFRRPKNKLSLSKEGKRTILKVKSIGSASSVLKRLEVDLNKFPVLVWRWKVNRVVGMAVETRKDRNDAAARIRVIYGRPALKPLRAPPEIEKLFKGFNFRMKGGEPRGHKIDYIWANAIPRGEIINYPGSKNHKMVVLQSGNKRTNKWIWEKRNLYKDFRHCFEGIPPMLIGIAVLTDTDQTNEGVIAHYSSIIMMSE